MTLRIAQDAAQKDKRHWRWSVWLEGSDDELDTVKEVIWKLHPSFSRPIRPVNSRGNGFRLESSGWGQFEIQAELHRSNGQVDNLRHWIRFDDKENLGKNSRSQAIDNTDGSLATSETLHPTIFLSYSRRGAQLAGVLAKTLKQRSINVLVDVDIPAGADLRRWIEEAISESDAVVFLATDQESLSHSFTGFELGYARAAGVRAVVVTLADELAANFPHDKLIQAKDGSPEDIAPFIAERIIESLGEASTH